MKNHTPTTSPELIEIARKCRALVNRSRVQLGYGLGGHSVLDLAADNLDYPLKTLLAALVLAGLEHELD